MCLMLSVFKVHCVYWVHSLDLTVAQQLNNILLKALRLAANFHHVIQSVFNVQLALVMYLIIYTIIYILIHAVIITGHTKYNDK